MSAGDLIGAAMPAGQQSLLTRVLLHDPSERWRLDRGGADIFAVELVDGQPVGPLRFLWSVEAVSVWVGVRAAAVPRPFGLLAVVHDGGQVQRLTPGSDSDPRGSEPATTAAIDAFILRACAAVGHDLTTAAAEGAGLLPRTTQLAAVSEQLPLWLAEYGTGVELAEQERLRRKASVDRQMRTRGLERLAGLLADLPDRAPVIAAGHPLLAACRIVGAAARIEFQPPPGWEVDRKVRDPLASICRASRVRSRQVALRGRWWTADHGPLLGFAGPDKQPVSLVQRGPTRYELIDPVSGQRRLVDAALASTLDPFAYEFYRPSPDHEISLIYLMRLMAAEARADLGRIGLAALAAALIGLLLPITTGRVFSDIIPMAVPANIAPLAAALIGVAIATALLDLTKALALVRIQGRMQSSLQAAIIDRLLSLPAPFFRRYATGDLAMRAFAINSARELLSGAAMTTLISGLFSLLNLALLFYYNPTLALVAVALLIVTIGITSTLAVLTLRVERLRQAVHGRVSGMLVDMLNGIPKLRVAGAEGRALALWAELFRQQRELALRGGLYQAVVSVFTELLPLVATAALFVAMGSMTAAGRLSTGDFIAFYAAFGTFFAMGLSLGSTTIGLLQIVPMLERARPILQATIERDASKPDPGELAGGVEVSQVSFRYAPDAPLVLDRVSFATRPGEFVALVGASGSGKSTLVRLLLGFESPESGSIHFDGQDLGAVDVTAVRAQIGCVLQNSQVSTGDIFSNIVGSSPLTVDDAWAAVAAVGLEDDVKAMPMGMNTVISDGASTLSGGQRQRLMIARAIVRRPRIIIFDEATSALDNHTQEIVSQSLARMQATRIVIAHRLSTIRHADRIYVMERGQVVQQGSYETLANTPGVFAQLIARQLI